jgi:hypothetical protein
MSLGRSLEASVIETWEHISAPLARVIDGISKGNDMKHIDGKTLLKAMELVKRGEKIELIMQRTGMGRAQVNELMKRASK